MYRLPFYRSLMALVASMALSATALAGVNQPRTLQVNMEYSMTTNTCEFSSTNPTYTLPGSEVAEVASGNAPLQKIVVQLDNCMAAGAADPAIQFVAQSNQHQGMALVDQNGTGAGFLLYKDNAGRFQIDPHGGDTASVPSATGNVEVPVWVKLTQVGATLTAGDVRALASVKIDYP